MHSKLPNLRRNTKGFTLVELLIVFAVIALIASIAIPSWQRSRKRSQADALINELRVTGDAFQVYSAEKGSLPPNSSGFSAIPSGMQNYMPKNSTWTGVSPTGGYWVFWNFAPTGVWGFNGIIGVYNPNFDPDQQLQIDTSIDDGDPNNGGIHTMTGWVFLGIP
jgi:prepilin-type N-terminal cleavage/methylation domain-containing protein